MMNLWTFADFCLLALLQAEGMPCQPVCLVGDGKEHES